MSRTLLRAALESRDGSALAIAPMIERHAGALEQIAPAGLLSDAEALARALRNAQALYGCDAVTIGAAGERVAAACWEAARPGLAPMASVAAVERGERLDELPAPASVVDCASLVVARDAMARLRPVLGDQAGIAIVLPDASHLAALLGRETSGDWASATLLEIVRLFGAEEPDLFLIVGNEHTLARPLASVADFFGSPIVHICGEDGCQAGVAVLRGDDFAGSAADIPAMTWLVTSSTELDVDSDPKATREAIAGMRRRRAVAG